ncbi:MAG: hypothetical protein SNJ81_07735 [Cyanobacteriota bacterium]
MQQHVEPAGVGVVWAESCPPGAKHRTTVAALHGQSPGTGQKFVRALGAGGNPPVAKATAVSGARYDGLVESLLHDSLVSDLLRTSGAAAVASFGAFECHG